MAMNIIVFTFIKEPERLLHENIASCLGFYACRREFVKDFGVKLC